MTGVASVAEEESAFIEDRSQSLGAPYLNQEIRAIRSQNWKWK
jgi:hypothetical protein